MNDIKGFGFQNFLRRSGEGKHAGQSRLPPCWNEMLPEVESGVLFEPIGQDMNLVLAREASSQFDAVSAMAYSAQEIVDDKSDFHERAFGR